MNINDDSRNWQPCMCAKKVNKRSSIYLSIYTHSTSDYPLDYIIRRPYVKRILHKSTQCKTHTHTHTPVELLVGLDPAVPVAGRDLHVVGVADEEGEGAAVGLGHPLPDVAQQVAVVAPGGHVPLLLVALVVERVDVLAPVDLYLYSSELGTFGIF